MMLRAASAAWSRPTLPSSTSTRSPPFRAPPCRPRRSPRRTRPRAPSRLRRLRARSARGWPSRLATCTRSTAPSHGGRAGASQQMAPGAASARGGCPARSAGRCATAPRSRTPVVAALAAAKIQADQHQRNLQRAAELRAVLGDERAGQPGPGCASWATGCRPPARPTPASTHRPTSGRRREYHARTASITHHGRDRRRGWARGKGSRAQHQEADADHGNDQRRHAPAATRTPAAGPAPATSSRTNSAAHPRLAAGSTSEALSFHQALCGPQVFAGQAGERQDAQAHQHDVAGVVEMRSGRARTRRGRC